MTERIKHWIGGQAHEEQPQRSGEVYNPATGVATGTVDYAGPELVDTAVRTAARAQREWGRVSLSKRTGVLFKFRELLAEHADELAALITAEQGKVASDAAGEIARGIENVEFACGIGHLLKGENTQNASTGVDVSSVAQPLGVVGIISPFNFPAMVPLWFAPMAIACGNAVVLKPSEKDPSAAGYLARLWQRAGLPDGVFNVVHGDKLAVDAVLGHELVQAVSFVGSTPIAKYVYEQAAANGKRVQALGGAKNHMVVLPDADLDAAADAAVSAGFGAAGERCMAVSVVVAVEEIADKLVQKVTERMRRLRVGDGSDPSSEMGPLVTAEHRDRVRGYVESGEGEGATLAFDGRAHDIDGAEGGFWLGPTLFDDVTPGMRLYRDEIFGPVLSVVRVPDFTGAVDLVNAGAYGNGTAIFTADGAAAREFSAEIEVGMVGVNVPIPVPVGYYSFGGWKDSLFGDTHAYGTEGVHFYTRRKVITSRWPTDQTHSGVNLAFPSN